MSALHTRYNNQTSSESTSFCPQLRPDVMLGPRLLSGNTGVHYIKDSRCNAFYRIGEREHFLISRMDGSHTLQQIEHAYMQSYGHHLNERSWASLFTLLGKRALLTHMADEQTLDTIKQRISAQKGGRKHARFILHDADRFSCRLQPLARLLFYPATVTAVTFLLLAMEGFFFLHLGPIFAQMLPGITQHPLSVLLLLVLVPLFIIAHECAHAAACKLFGGSVPEMGMGWRFFLPYTYCQIDDIVLFPRRWQRVFTAFAGIYINLLMVVPFALLWWLSPVNSLAHTLGILVLVVINLLTLANGVPFAELDGYLMLKHALNMIDLRENAYQAWRQVFGRYRATQTTQTTQTKQSKQQDTYTGWRLSIYFAYGLLSLLYPLVLLVGVIIVLVLIGQAWHIL